MVYTDGSAIERIRRNDGTVAGKMIQFTGRQPGLKLLGAIDYLVHKFGYIWMRK